MLENNQTLTEEVNKTLACLLKVSCRQETIWWIIYWISLFRGLFFLWTHHTGHSSMSYNVEKNGLIKEYWRYATMNFPFWVTLTNLMFKGVIIIMSILSGSGLMFPLSLLYMSDISAQSHMATMTKCWHWVVDVCLLAGWRAVLVSQTLSVIWNHWSSSYQQPLWCPNKSEFDKSHVQRGWGQKQWRVAWSSLKPDFPFKNINRLPGCDPVTSRWHYSGHGRCSQTENKKPTVRWRHDKCWWKRRWCPVCLFCLPNLNKGTPTSYTPPVLQHENKNLFTADRTCSNSRVNYQTLDEQIRDCVVYFST